MTTPFPFSFLGPIGTPELLVTLFIVLLLFGAKKLPELARGLGTAKNEFQKASSDEEKSDVGATKDATTPAAKSPPPPATDK
jgi:sec-independent protein translocase protein TatA